MDIVEQLRITAHVMVGEQRNVALMERAADEIKRLRDLVQTLIENDPDEPISDGGHVVLDLWRHEARQALGIKT